MNSDFQSQSYCDPRDKKGFATPTSPSDALRLLNGYLRTGLFYDVQQTTARLHENSVTSPVYILVEALESVLNTASPTPSDRNSTNPYNVMDDGHRFDPKADYQRDLKMIRHHLKSLKEIIADIESIHGS